ncbi:MAG: fasciclin domain-containing protein [Bacteroidota bacterium]
MKKILLVPIAILSLLFMAQSVSAQCGSHKQRASAVRVHYSSGGSDDVVSIAVNSPVHTTLVAAVKAAGLVGTLQSDGPFTVFAPTNGAFNKLPEGTVETLLKPANKATLTNILTYHVLSGNFDSTTLVNTIKSNGGKVNLPTVSGGTLTAKIKGDKVMLQDENGGTSTITAVDLKGSNGIVHIIDTVVLPK